MDNTLETLWKMEEKSSTSPNIEELIQDENNQVATVVIFVIVSVLVIVLIFLMAIFIDCRQQKIHDAKIKSLRKRARRKIQRVIPKLPTIGESRKKEDEQNIVDHMQAAEPTASSSSDIP
ncbi:uncharacterized protein LOC143199800 [Rhynchophorus ferrugineus]|uniref:Uncharacterized protein n=1 Tax=Rhynchophorus ferrugineus TaxID=354439 RepID=A0A834M8E6_RHYFE|nr:hypothetical protein GWI33_016671 [Rhynchophorus ferrugineus]